MEPDYQWTIDDVGRAAKRAEMKEYAASEARSRARSIEQAYWEQQLEKVAARVGGPFVLYVKYKVTVGFSDGDYSCVMEGPLRDSYHGVCIRIWHKGSKGRLHKYATRYRCSEIIPFIKQIEVLLDGEVAKK